VEILSSGHHRTTLLSYIFATSLRYASAFEKKLVKQQYIPHMSSQYDKLRPLTAEIGSVI